MARTTQILYNINGLLSYYDTRSLKIVILCYGTDVHKKERSDLQSFESHEVHVDAHEQ